MTNNFQFNLPHLILPRNFWVGDVLYSSANNISKWLREGWVMHRIAEGL
jgi:hypothetical protein